MKIRTVCTSIALILGLLSGYPAAAEEPPKKIPVTVKADKLDYDRANDIYVAEGHVRIEQDSMRAEADKIILNNRTGETVAEGNVYLQEKGDIIRADRLQININTKAGLMYNGDLFMGKDNLHLKGEVIERRSESVYHIENGIFTTCDEGEWYLKADKIDVDMNRYAVGRGVSFNMIGLPVLYTPYLLFPVRRQSGLLIPETGYSSSEGFLLKNSLFWAISDYQDMTFYSDYRARHGLGSALEYRYENSRDSGGRLFYNFFDVSSEYRDRTISDFRAKQALAEFGLEEAASLPAIPGRLWLFSYEHHEEIAEDLSLRADINVVNHYSYFQELETPLELRSQPYIDSNLFYIERWDTSSLYLLGQYAVDLTQQENEKTFQKLPELRYNIFEEKIAGPLHLNFDGTATNFARRAGESVMRADLNPRVSAVLGGGGITLTPRAGFRGTYYSRSSTSSEPTERKYYYAEVDLNSRFSRIYGSDREAGFGKIRHSIEPSVSYSYIPKIDQADLPQLDVGTAVQQNLVTVALLNRLTAHYRDNSGSMTYDLMILRLSESYDIGKARSRNPSHPRSEVRAELYLKTPRLLSFSAAETFNTYTHEVTSSTESAGVNIGTLRFNMSHQAVREPKTRYVIAGAGATLGKWDIDGKLWRDIVQKKTTQREYKLHYASQCWGTGIMYIKKPGETQYLFTLDLKGLGVLKF